MKNLLSASLLCCLFTASLANAQVRTQPCNPLAIQNQLQAMYNYKYKNVPYGKKRVESMRFVALLKSGQSMNVMAGGDDRDIMNTYKSDIAVYSTYIRSFGMVNYNAILVDPTLCKVVNSLNIAAYAE